MLKTNDNQRYATHAATGFVVREIARRAGIPVQEFVVRNDCPCGTTIGPIIAARVGLRTADVGIPSLSMHSIRCARTWPRAAAPLLVGCLNSFVYGGGGGAARR